MEIEKINQQYLRIAGNEELETAEVVYGTRVLQKKTVEGLLTLRKRSMDGQLFYYYEIGGLHSMEETLEGSLLTEKEMNNFMQCLGETLRQLEEFLLKQERLCLNPAFIMFDGVKRKWNFLYRLEPFEEQGQEILELLDFFLSKLGGETAGEDWFYEYFTDSMQFGDTICPSELARIWSEKRRRNLPVKMENEEPLVQERQQEVRQVMDEVKNLERDEIEEGEYCRKASWKENVNRIVYAKLYLVPFCPH